MLVAENEIESRVQEELKRKELEAKRSRKSQNSLTRRSLKASESEKIMRDKLRADVRYERFKAGQEIREKKERIEKAKR